MNKKIIAIIISFIMIFSVSACKKNDNEQQPEEKDFLTFANEIFLDEVQCDTLSLHYSIAHPENYGIEHFEPTFGTFSAEENKEALAACENYISILNSYNYKSLSEKEQLIYDILMDSLTSLLLINKTPYLYEGLGPTTGFQAQLPVLLAEYTFYDKEDIEDYIKLIEDTKRYFSEIAEFERIKSDKGYFMMDDTADEIISQCLAFIQNPGENMLITCFNQKLQNIPDLGKDEITLYEERNRDAVLNYVIPAYQTLIDVLTELKGTGSNKKGLAGFDRGADYYEALTKQKTGSDKTIKEMKKALNKELQSNLTTLSNIQISEPTIVDQYNSYEYPYTNPEEIVEYLKEAITKDFPALLNVDYSVKYVHESLQEFLSPAMYLIPPIDDHNANNIYINLNPDYDLSELFPTVAHESYPGHLYQTVYFKQTNPEPIQGLLSSTGYTEGWGLYTERYSYEYAGLSDSLCEFLQANLIATHCLYSLSDIGINYDGWSKSDTVAFYATYGIDAEGAEAVYNTMVAEPCVYLPYAIGYIEFNELREQAETELSNGFSSKEFHSFLLNLGPAPFPVVEKHLVNWLEGKK